PAVPDDVAATLARMMAKDPGERYQQPEHLVQHLLVLAQKVGAPASGADGVLFVDAPLPSPPQMRPAFLMAAPAVLLVPFIALFGPSPTPATAPRPGGARAAPKGNGEAAVQDVGAVPKIGPGAAEKIAEQPAAAAQPAEPGWRTIETAKELAEYLEKNDVARV